MSRRRAKNRRGQRAVRLLAACRPMSGLADARGTILSPRASASVVPDGRGVSREGWPRPSGSSLAASPGVKAPREVVACVREQLDREQQLAAQLDNARKRLVTCLDDGRRSGVAWTTLARAVLGRPATVAEVRRLAGALRARSWRR